MMGRGRILLEEGKGGERPGGRHKWERGETKAGVGFCLPPSLALTCPLPLWMVFQGILREAGRVLVRSQLRGGGDRKPGQAGPHTPPLLLLLLAMHLLAYARVDTRSCTGGGVRHRHDLRREV
eukprot:2230273-Rhodomonas_salina.1